MLKDSKEEGHIKILAKDYEFEKSLGENDVNLKIFDDI